MHGEDDVREAESWVAGHTPIVGGLEHVQTEPWGSVFRATGPSAEVLWFKTCAPHQAFEVPFTASLSARWPTTVTEVLAYDAERRWLLMSDAGQPLRTLGNPPERWLEVLPAYAQLQIEETERAAEHLDAGVPDLRLELLPARYDELLAVGLPLAPNETAALEAFRQPFTDLCAELEGQGIGPTVQHDDLHMNNIYVKGDSIRVLDWGDASIGHPFFSLFETFRFLVELNRLNPGDAWFGRLRAAYLEPWGPGHVETFDLALRIAGLARAIAWIDQRNALTQSDRPEFDAAFVGLLGIALEAGTGSMWC